jgi:FkbM family methyltransferase
MARALMKADKSPECANGSCVFIDGGAAFGYYSLLAYHKAPQLLVHSFNPHPRFVKQMMDNLILNRVERGVCIHQIGLASNKTQFGTLEYGTGTTIHADNLDFSSNRVRLTTLDTFIARHVYPSNKHVVVVKLDIEGFAGEALRGATKLVHSQQVKVWFIGIHNTKEKLDATAILSDAGYTVVSIVRGSANPNDAIVATLP